MSQKEAQQQSEAAAASELVAKGLDHYGRNEVDSAVACWRQAAELDASNQQALDYLDAAGFEPVVPGGAQVIDISTARRILTPLPPAPDPKELQGARMRELETLLEGKRYEEALELLLRARIQEPNEPAISRGIRLLKDRLLLDYVRRLGDLDQIPVRGDGPAPSSEPEKGIYTLVDGIASIDDLLQVSPLGRFETYRCLARLLDRNAITLSDAAPWSLPVPEPKTEVRAKRPHVEGTAAPVQSPASKSLEALTDLDGFLGASLIDSGTGRVLGRAGGSGFDLELASALNADVVRCKLQAMETLGLSEQLEDIVVTLPEQYHITRAVKDRPEVLLYLVTDRSRSNLALARMRLIEFDSSLAL